MRKRKNKVYISVVVNYIQKRYFIRKWNREALELFIRSSRSAPFFLFYRIMKIQMLRARDYSTFCRTEFKKLFLRLNASSGPGHHFFFIRVSSVFNFRLMWRILLYLQWTVTLICRFRVGEMPFWATQKYVPIWRRLILLKCNFSPSTTFTTQSKREYEFIHIQLQK